LTEFGAQNKVIETGPCLGTKLKFEKPGLQSLQTLWNWGYWNFTLSGQQLGFAWVQITVLF